MKHAKTNPENADSVNGNKSYLWNISTGLLLDIFLSVSAGCTRDNPSKLDVEGGYLHGTWCCPAGSDEQDVKEEILEEIGCIRIGDDIESGKFINKDWASTIIQGLNK